MMKRLLPFIGLALLLFATGAHADLSNSGMMTDIATRYQTAASGWATYITGRATWMFWALVTISMVFTFGLMAVKGAGLQDFFAEFVRFIMFTGFFWWLLSSAPTFVPGIYQSLSTIGASASGLGSDLKPSGIVDIGFVLFNKVMDNSTLWEPIDSLIGFLMAVVILICLALVAVNMVVLLVSGWVLGYAGIIYLGFGGSRWTSDMAIGFYKTVLAIGIQLMTMILLVGIGKTFLDDYYGRMATGNVELKEMAVLMVASLLLLVLVNKVPQLVSSIASGNVGMSGLGSYGAGTALGALGMAGAAAGVGAAMVSAGAANIAGGASAIKAAFSQAGANVSSGTDVMAKMAGGGSAGADGGASGAGGGGSGGMTASSTPFAQAAGLSTPGGGASVSSIAGRSSSASSSGDGQGGGAGEAVASMGTDASAGGIGGAAGGGGSFASSAPSAGEGGQASSSAASATSSSSMAGRAAAAAAKAGRIAADAGANLAMGAYDVGKQAVADRMDKFGERVAQTTGGKIASAIQERGAAGVESPTFAGDGFAAGDTSQAQATSTDPEVAAFVRRGEQA